MEIELRRRDGSSFLVLIDDDDYGMVSEITWHIETKTGYTEYAAGHVTQDGVDTTVRMHSLITGWGRVDHINGNGLDNRRVNLRPATHAQNQQNSFSRVGTSQYKGVWFDGSHKWRAYITSNGVRRYLGTHTNEEVAARAYDEAALELHGQYARLNFPTPSTSQET